MAKLAPWGPFQAFDNNGALLAGGKLYTYEARSTTPKAVYQDSGEVAAHQNPVILDAAGRAEIWLGAGGYYWVLKDAQGNTLWDLDDITGDAENRFGATTVIVGGNMPVTTIHENALLVCTATATLSLLPLSDASTGFVFSVRNDGNGVVTLDPDGTEQIDGLDEIKLYPGQSCTIIAGAQWYTLGRQSGIPSDTKTANYTVVEPDNGRPIMVDATAAAITVSVLDAATAGDGFLIPIKKVDSSVNAVTLDFAGANTGDGAGTILLSNQNDSVILISDGTKWETFARHVAADWYPPVIPGHIGGLTLSNDVTDANNDIVIAPGIAADSTATKYMRLASALTKRLDAAWAVGNAQGGLFSGSKANSTWYHLFEIMDPATGTVDAGFDTSVTAANRPVDYTLFRRIGSVRTDGSGNILAFAQYGSDFIWATPPRDINDTATGTSTKTAALTVPTGVPVRVWGSAFINDNNVFARFTTISPTAAGTPDNSSGPIANIGTVSSGGVTGVVSNLWTDTSAQVRYRTNSNTTIRFTTEGWMDPRA